MKICKKLILASFLAHNNPQKSFWPGEFRYDPVICLLDPYRLCKKSLDILKFSS